MIGNVRSAGGGTHGAFTWDMLAAVTGPPTSLFDERSEPDRAKSEGEPLACSFTPKIDHNEAIRHRATLDLGIARLLFAAALGQNRPFGTIAERPITDPERTFGVGHPCRIPAYPSFLSPATTSGISRAGLGDKSSEVPASSRIAVAACGGAFPFRVEGQRLFVPLARMMARP
jgi:hypothetical protein